MPCVVSLAVPALSVGNGLIMLATAQTDGLTPFTKRSESEYDPFGAGHSSTSISAGLGMAVGRDIKGAKNNVIAVIGDGARHRDSANSSAVVAVALGT